MRKRLLHDKRSWEGEEYECKEEYPTVTSLLRVLKRNKREISLRGKGSISEPLPAGEIITSRFD